MTQIVVFSKDRACQLDLCLRTIEEKFHVEKNIIVQFAASNNLFMEGYQKLIGCHPGVKFVKETSFQETFLNSLRPLFQGRYILFLVDDDIFINSVDETEIRALIEMYENNPLIHSISLRMNPDVNFCYPARKHIQRPHEFLIENNIMRWNWTQACPHYCWGYPHPIDSHIYELTRVDFIFTQEKYNNPNEFECAFLANTNRNLPYMISPVQSKIFSIQNNFVKAGAKEKSLVSPEELNSLFLSGKKISTKNLYGYSAKQVHGRIPYEYE